LRARARCLLAPLLICALSGEACASSRKKTAEPRERDPWAGRGEECVRAFLGQAPDRELAFQTIDDPLLTRLPAEARRTARAAGIEPLVAAALHKAQETEPTLALLSLKQDLGLRLISLETQLAAIIFEAECTGELIEAMTFELDQSKQTRSLVFAVASLVVGAGFSAAAGIWDLAGEESHGPAVMALSGGLASAGLGGAAFVPGEKRLRYLHARNLLVPILRNEDPEGLYPSFVFRLLNLPVASGQASPREKLVARFQELIDEYVTASKRADAARLLYGEGGLYSEDTLALRERMYDALETQLNALARDLEQLDRSLVLELSSASPGPENGGSP
jgi:hypothetical protein